MREINQSSGHLQHPHQDISAIAALLLTLGADAVYQVQQEFAGHGLDATGQGLIIDVLGKELDGEGKVTEGQVLANVMHKVSKCAVGEGSAGRDAISVFPVVTAGTAGLRGEGPEDLSVHPGPCASPSCSNERPNLSRHASLYTLKS